MAQRKKPAAKMQVRMLCTLSGTGQSWGPGTIIEFERLEAERLIALGAAEPVEAK